MRIKPLLKRILGKKIIRIYHYLQAWFWCMVYRWPAKDFYVIGVTGTKGKTTTCHLINAVLKADGKKTGLLSTIGFEIAGNYTANSLRLTTPTPRFLNKFFSDCKKAGCSHIVLEISSHAIDQRRILGIPVKAAVFTNLSHDHLDYHQTLTLYKETKKRLWLENEVELSVICKDDNLWSEFLRLPADRKILYGIENITSEEGVVAKKVQLFEQGSRFTIICQEGQVPIELKLPGKFNILNALAAFAVGWGLGIDFQTIKKGLESVDLVPGRMERVPLKNGLNVIIDYAHNPDSLKKVYEAIKPSVRGRLIAVLGACGNRDRSKRPIMGALAGSFADIVIITNEDPYDEDPQKIIDEVASGVRRGDKNKKLGENFFKILSRREAILKALSLATPSDLVLITGKGAEDSIVWAGGRKTPWSDKKVVEELAEKLINK
jgi:UDP-N-acetylmuramoyl-L-alanyl-D-glutamate--2,6-diaminopimelate ligase